MAKRYEQQEEERDTNERSNRRNRKTGKGKGKRKAPSSGKESKTTKLSATEDYNDISYYVKDPVLVEQATQISFQNILGIEPFYDYQIPTIMRILMNPSVGLTYQGSNPNNLNHPSRAGVNLSALKLFNRLSMSSGRNMAYAPQDLAIMHGAVSQVLAMVSYGRRALGSAKLANYRNRMVPKALVEVQGFDYDDLVDHWADYRTAFNNAIAVLNQIPIIGNIGFIKKSMNQYDYVFLDADSPMAQMYLYVPYSTWIIDETTSSDGSVLKTLPVVKETPTLMTFQSFLQDILRPMINALIESSTLNLVYADVLHLAATTNDLELYSVPIVPDDYVVMPFHNYEALLNVHNATAVGVPNFPSRTGYVTPLNDVYCDPSNNSHH